MNLNPSRFKRLFLISFTLIVVIFPVQFYIFYINLSFPRIPYSWNLIHGKEWWNIILIPTGGVVAFDRWVRLACGFLVFLFFGLGKDAVNMYSTWLCKLGLGKVFPDLERRDSNASSETSSSSGSRSWGSILSSRARLVFKKNHRDNQNTTSSNGSVTTEVITPSPSDPKKQFFPLSSSNSERSSSQTARSEKPLPELPTQAIQSWHQFSVDLEEEAPQIADEEKSMVERQQQHRPQHERSNSYVTVSWTPDDRQFAVRRTSEPA